MPIQRQQIPPQWVGIQWKPVYREGAGQGANGSVRGGMNRSPPCSTWCTPWNTPGTHLLQPRHICRCRISTGNPSRRATACHHERVAAGLFSRECPEVRSVKAICLYRGLSRDVQSSADFFNDSEIYQVFCDEHARLDTINQLRFLANLR